VDAGGIRVLADPLLRPRIGPLRRFVNPPDVDGLGLTPADELDAVVISHLHHDHCDLPTLRLLRYRHLLVPPGSAGFFSAHGVPGARELAPGHCIDIGGGVSVTAVPADHVGKRAPFGPTAEAVGHLVESRTASAWLAGDTGLFDAMADLAALGRRGVVDVAAVPVWGWGPNLGPGHMDPEQAAEAVRRIGVGRAFPVHWGTLHPPMMRRTMMRHLTTPGPRFVSRVEEGDVEATATLLDVGASLET
jgi:L-ascorbate metabolism protein UlaG (beta-lactamase superfamily)